MGWILIFFRDLLSLVAASTNCSDTSCKHYNAKGQCNLIQLNSCSTSSKDSDCAINVCVFTMKRCLHTNCTCSERTENAAITRTPISRTFSGEESHWMWNSSSNLLQCRPLQKTAILLGDSPRHLVIFSFVTRLSFISVGKCFHSIINSICRGHMGQQ